MKARFMTQRLRLPRAIAPGWLADAFLLPPSLPPFLLSSYSCFGGREAGGGLYVLATLTPAYFIFLHSHLLTLPVQSAFPSYFLFRSHTTL